MTNKGLPQYLRAVDTDVFIVSGAEELVPVYRQDPEGIWIAGRPGFQRDADGFWVRDPSGRLVVHKDELDGYHPRRYRPRIEGLFARIDRWDRQAISIPDQPACIGRAAQPGYPGVVRSTGFTYDDERDSGLATRPVYSFLKQVVQAGWKQEGGSTTRCSLPPVDFEYTEPLVQNATEEVDPRNLENLSVGMDGSGYRWTDLHGEGIPGILTEQAGTWFYRRKLSPPPSAAEFAPLETVAWPSGPTWP
jgi:hypothetical protein